MTTVDRLIATPFGDKIGSVWGTLEILGVASKLTQTLNRSNDSGLVLEEFVDISIPPGTLLVIPAVNFWLLAHGSASPEAWDPSNENETFTWNTEDHNRGLVWVQVSVDEVHEADFSVDPPQQTATLRIALGLSDENGDDSWFGKVGYSLIFFGKPPNGAGLTQRVSIIEPTAARTRRTRTKAKAGKIR